MRNAPRPVSRATWVVLGAMVLGAMALGACAEGSGPIPGGDDVPPSLTVVNESQFALNDLRVHAETDYQDAPNLLATPLLERQTFFIEHFPSGSYVTVIRTRVGHGEDVAISTSHGLDIVGNGYELLVFDDAFRLMPP